MAALAYQARARADEGRSLAAPPASTTPGATTPAASPALPEPLRTSTNDVNLDFLPQPVLDRPLVLPALVSRYDLSVLGGGGGGYSPTFGFLPAISAGVGGGLELTFSVPLLIGQRVEPHFGAQVRLFGSKPVELGLRALVSYPTGPDDAVADVAFVVVWRTGRWIRVDTEFRGAFGFSSTVRTGFVWPTIFTVQVSSGFFLGGTTELDVITDLGRAIVSVGGFLGGSLAHDGHALCDLRVGGTARDVAGSVGAELVFTASFYVDPR